MGRNLMHFDSATPTFDTDDPELVQPKTTGACCQACGRPFDDATSEANQNKKKLLGLLGENQRQVLGHLLAGLTEPQIAKKLHRSRHTVHDHTKAIYAVCGVNNRVQLVHQFEGIDPETLIDGRIPQFLQ